MTTFYYLIYSPLSETLGITDGYFKNLADFQKHIENTKKFVKVIFYAPYKYVVEDKKAEILAKMDKEAKMLSEVIIEYI